MKRLGDILVESGLLTGEQVERAAASHKKANLKLGQYLVQSGGITENQIADAVARQMKIERYRPEDYPLDALLREFIASDIAHKDQVVPLKKKGFLLKVAMTDPFNIHVLDAIESATNCEIEPVICTEKEFNSLFTSVYGSYGMDGVMDFMEQMQYGSGPEDAEHDQSESVDVNSLQDMVEEAPVVRIVNSLLSQAIREGASDIHISPEKDFVQVRFRVDGKLHEVTAPPKHMILSIISRFKLLANMDISLFRVPQDGRFSIKMNHNEINVRSSTIPTIYGENLVMRLLDSSGGGYDLEELGMAEEDMSKIESVIFKPYGMILSTGPTGSGKTTTLYSILKRINRPDINIITLEDPVEYRIERIRQIHLNEKAGMTFAGGIRSILRQDPDVIMVGEIRDAETASVATQAALTGHRMLSTIHTNNAAGAITRFFDMKIDPFLISSVLLVSIAQRLIRKICPFCGESYVPPENALEYWGFSPENKEMRFFQAKGCFSCMNTGYKGRTGIYEILIIDEMIQEMIIEKRSAQDVTRMARESGKFNTLKDNVSEKIAQGITTVDEAASAVMI